MHVAPNLCVLLQFTDSFPGFPRNRIAWGTPIVPILHLFWPSGEQNTVLSFTCSAGQTKKIIWWVCCVFCGCRLNFRFCNPSEWIWELKVLLLHQDCFQFCGGHVLLLRIGNSPCFYVLVCVVDCGAKGYFDFRNSVGGHKPKVYGLEIAWVLWEGKTFVVGWITVKNVPFNCILCIFGSDCSTCSELYCNFPRKYSTNSSVG